MSSYLYQFLDTVGDGSGSFEANVNGAITPVTFKILPRGPREALSLHRMIVNISAGAPGFGASSYGNVSALTNGLTGGIYRVSDDAPLHTLSGGFAVRSNADWGALCFDARPLDFGNGAEFFQARWTFTRAGAPLWIPPGVYFGVSVRDDLSTLARHTFHMQGRREVYNPPSA